MLLPRGDEYNVAVQNPRISFNDADLKSSSVETTPLGLPKPYSGGFTITYKLSNGQKGWAVRCFHKDISDLQRRYQAIETFLSKNNSKYFVEAKYLSNGIKVNGKPYPIIKMQWLEGEPLNVYLSKNYTQKAKVEKLLSDFVNLINELERFGIAHGDLQHGNIIVKNDSLYLIDYDGMYFPELATLKTNEIGHINYQHPKRSASHYNQHIDRFSSLVIYIGLKAISINPSLWKKYDNSENILFKRQDFADLQNSSLISDLSAISEIKPLIERFIGCCHLDFEKVPNLKDFLSGNFTYNKSAAGTISINRSQYLILDASKVGSILEHFGEKIEVVGKIGAIKSSTTKYGDPYTFLNFGGAWPNHTFTIVIWQEGLAALKANGISPSSLVGKWVSVTGVIASYGNKPQTVVELAAQIQILSSENEANQRLQFKPTPKQPIQVPVTPKKVIDKEVDVFNDLYKDKPVSPPPKATIKTPPTTSTYKPPTTSYKPPTPSYTSTSQTTKSSSSSTSSSDNNGCIVPIIFAVIGAAIIGSASNGKLWFLGAIGGGILGGWVQSWFKS
ncbi:MAG: hypothetical protein KatS3mg031_3083 [Chitinophagales bacterium]|nr:MAG: hypothetical protein KatS3mg031_3083 [Chitinophagales bacterium]